MDADSEEYETSCEEVRQVARSYSQIKRCVFVSCKNSQVFFFFFCFLFFVFCFLFFVFCFCFCFLFFVFVFCLLSFVLYILFCFSVFVFC